MKEATLNAMAFARETLGAERTQSLQLEEIESASEGGLDVWRITLSMPESDLGKLGFMNPRREYKMFSVVKDTGEVLSMRIRELSQT